MPPTPSSFFFVHCYRAQALFNLAGNSAKFTKQGVISLSAAFAESDGVESVESPGVLITVADTGRGISESMLESIRNFGEQGNAEDAAIGSGIGLSFVDKICAALYDTRPTIQSALNRGTTISFVAKLVPVHDEFVSPAQVVAAANDDARQAPFQIDDPTPRCCLVCDDVPMIRKMLHNSLSKVLPSSAWSIITAENGEMAIEMAKQQRIDLATIDFHMESTGGLLNGAETTVQLKALSSATVCIGVTGSDIMTGPEAAALLAAGCFDVMGKPAPKAPQIRKMLFG